VVGERVAGAAVGQVVEEPSVLDVERLVEAELVAGRLDLVRAGARADVEIGRVAPDVESQERDERDAEDDEYGLQQPS